MKKTTKSEKFFAKGFDDRFPLAWWRFVDPYAGYARFLGWGQHICEALGLSVALDLYEARIRLRTNFESLVQKKAWMEICTTMELRLNVYKDLGYAVDDGIRAASMRDLVDALCNDEEFRDQMARLQRLPASRKALYYRIWALWDVDGKYGAEIVHARVMEGK